MATKSLYVGNIPHGTGEQELRDLFNDYGPVGDVRVIEGKGFAFVDLPGENVPDAIAALNGQDFNGRALRIDEARPRRERTGGGGGGGRRFGGGGGYGGGGGGGGGGYGGGGRRGGGGGGRGRDRDRDW